MAAIAEDTEHRVEEARSRREESGYASVRESTLSFFSQSIDRLSEKRHTTHHELQSLCRQYGRCSMCGRSVVPCGAPAPAGFASSEHWP